MARTSNPTLIDRRKREIVEATIICIRSNGFHRTSMQEICTEAQISAGALYRYFRSKDVLLAEVIRTELGRAAAITDTAQTDGPERALERLARDYLELSARDGSVILEVIAQASDTPEVRGAIAEVRAERQEVMKDLILRMLKGGTPQNSAIMIARAVHATLDGFGLELCLFPDRPPAELCELFMAHVERLMSAEGLRPH